MRRRRNRRQDQVEIGASPSSRGRRACRARAPRSAAPRMMAVGRGEILARPRDARARITTSASRAKASPACSRRHRAGEDARADQEHVLLAEHADAVEQVLVVARLRRARASSRRVKLRVVRQRAEEARIDQRVHHLRIARQRYRRAAARCRAPARSARSGRGSAAAARTAARRRADWRGSGRRRRARRRDSRCAPDCSSSTGTSSADALRATSPLSER